MSLPCSTRNVFTVSGSDFTFGIKSLSSLSAGLWKINGSAYQEDKGKKLYRRSMYTIWKRSVPHPTIATFDAPERSFCAVRRQETNTPLQALVLMNDPTYVEASRVLGYNMLQYSDPKASPDQGGPCQLDMELACLSRAPLSNAVAVRLLPLAKSF